MAREILQVAGAVIGQYFGGPIGAQIGYQIGNAIGSAIDPLEFQGPKLGDAAVQTSRDGIPIPLVWGVSHIVGNIIQINPIVTSKIKTGDKKSGKVVTERHSRTFAIGICRSVEGPITGILRVWENNKLVYDVRTGSTFPAADNTAFEAATSIYLGTETQLPDSELESHSGVGNTPAYRALAYIVFNNKDITNFGSSIPSYRFEIYKCHSLVGSTVASAGGIASTQENFYPAATANFPHPFEGERFDEFTMSIVCKQTTRVGVSQADHYTAFNFRFSADDTMLKVSRDGAGNMIFTGIMSTDLDTGWAAQGNPSVSDSLWEDWYWVGMSYSNVSGPTGHVYAVNLRTGVETGVAINSQNSEDVAWDADLDGVVRSAAFYGLRGSAASVLAEPWIGYLSQMYVHNKYIDLSVVGNRRLFCSLDGAISYGLTGEIPLGERPLIYLPKGHPSINLGTRFIGTWDSDFWIDPAKVEGPLPPSGS